MPVSTSTDFIMTRDDIIRTALRRVGALAEGEQPSAQTMKDAATTLNLMIKYWQSKGINLWTLSEAVLFQAYGQQSYPMGPSSATRVCNVSALVETTAEAASSGAGTITVADDAGLTSGMAIGIYCNTGLIHWTTISGAPVANVVTLAAPLAADVAADSPVYAYSTTVQFGRPMKVTSARQRQLSDGSDIPLAVTTRDDYFALPTKGSLGLVNQVYYDPQIGTGMLYVWPSANDVRVQVRFTYQRTLADFDAIADNPDYPQEWYHALTWGLARELLPEYGIIGERANDIKLMAAQSFNDLSGYDTDVAVYIQPAIRVSGG